MGDTVVYFDLLLRTIGVRVLKFTVLYFTLLAQSKLHPNAAKTLSKTLWLLHFTA